MRRHAVLHSSIAAALLCASLGVQAGGAASALTLAPAPVPVPLTEAPIDVSAVPSFDPQAAQQQQQRLADLTRLGRLLFRDKTLSGSGRVACASCHDPAHAFSAPNRVAVQRGGRSGHQAGTRAVPSLQYLQTTPVFTEHFFEDEGAKAGQDGGPTGGFTWDGRVDRLRDQALIPLFAINEMATTPQRLQQSVQQARYAPLFRSVFGLELGAEPGAAASIDPAKWVQGIALALETYQQSPAEFYPYTSKYDAVLRGQATLTAQEARGLDAFNREDKGNCASCHPSQRSESGGFPQFTDYGYAALGLPRNTRIPANAQPGYFDRGLCGPARTDLADKAEYCGLFKVPSLRNVARKKIFYHNAAATNLTAAVRFYVERDARPERWYPRDATGRLQRFNDLPARYRDNLEVAAPFGQKPGERSPLTAANVREIVAFLKTLTDGYRP